MDRGGENDIILMYLWKRTFPFIVPVHGVRPCAWSSRWLPQICETDRFGSTEGTTVSLFYSKHMKSYCQSKVHNQSIRSKQSFSDSRNHMAPDRNEHKSSDLNKPSLQVQACSTCVCMHWTICRFLICVSGQICLKQRSILFYAENSVAAWRKYSWGVPPNTQIKHETDAEERLVPCQLEGHVCNTADVSAWLPWLEARIGLVQTLFLLNCSSL